MAASPVANAARARVALRSSRRGVSCALAIASLVAYCRGRAVVIGAVLKDLGLVDAGEEHDSQQEQELDGDSVR